MPRHTHLMRRGSRYYLNVKVPTDLRHVLKKEIIRKSLGTSDYGTAIQRVRVAVPRFSKRGFASSAMPVFAW